MDAIGQASARPSHELRKTQGLPAKEVGRTASSTCRAKVAKTFKAFDERMRTTISVQGKPRATPSIVWKDCDTGRSQGNSPSAKGASCVCMPCRSYQPFPDTSMPCGLRPCRLLKGSLITTRLSRTMGKWTFSANHRLLDNLSRINKEKLRGQRRGGAKRLGAAKRDTIAAPTPTQQSGPVRWPLATL